MEKTLPQSVDCDKPHLSASKGSPISGNPALRSKLPEHA